MFSSRKDDGHILRQIAYRRLNEDAVDLGLEEIETHTLKKTFGYHYYQETKDINFLTTPLLASQMKYMRIIYVRN